MSKMFEAIEGIQKAHDINDIAVELSRFAAFSGYEFWHIGKAASCDTPLAKKKMLDAWPMAWLRQYDHERFVRNDAIWQSCRTSQRPFRWSDIQIADDRSKQIMNIAKSDFRMSEGFCVPFYGLEGYGGAISFAGRDVDQERSVDLRLAVVAIYAFNRLNEIQGLEPRPKLLTARQREVIKWIAAGKTAWDIAEILRISEETVRTTTKAAMARLNVHTRGQAVAEAFRLKEISV